MTQHEHEHHNQHDHGHHDHGHSHKKKGLHKDWRAWLVVILMLAAIGMYLASDDEAFQPGNPAPQERVPEAL